MECFTLPFKSVYEMELIYFLFQFKNLAKCQAFQRLAFSCNFADKEGFKLSYPSKK